MTKDIDPPGTPPAHYRPGNWSRPSLSSRQRDQIIAGYVEALVDEPGLSHRAYAFRVFHEYSVTASTIRKVLGDRT